MNIHGSPQSGSSTQSQGVSPVPQQSLNQLSPSVMGPRATLVERVGSLMDWFTTSIRWLTQVCIWLMVFVASGLGLYFICKVAWKLKGMIDAWLM